MPRGAGRGLPQGKARLEPHTAGTSGMRCPGGETGCCKLMQGEEPPYDLRGGWQQFPTAMPSMHACEPPTVP